MLQYLENIRVVEFEDVKSGYKVSMVSGAFQHCSLNTPPPPPPRELF